MPLLVISPFMHPSTATATWPTQPPGLILAIWLRRRFSLIDDQNVMSSSWVSALQHNAQEVDQSLSLQSFSISPEFHCSVYQRWQSRILRIS